MLTRALHAILLNRPRAALAGTGLFVVLAAGVIALAGDRLQVSGYTTPGAPSTQASDHLRHILGYDPEPGLLVLARTSTPAGGCRPRRSRR